MSILDHKFPPILTSIYTEELANQLANTQGALSGLNQLSRLLHNPNLLMHPILAKEAESSSQLEGTQASIEDVYKIDIMEQSEEKRNEAFELRNYEQAMFTGIAILEKLPLNNFAIREIHRNLMKGVRGKDKHPGEFRKGDVWIGTKGTKKEHARYIPPDALQIPGLMERLIKFTENPGSLHPLITCGILHHRFEAIHPFEDGNGRTGRLLISLYLIKNGLLNLPILYPSGYFEKNREDYMNSLSFVDKKEDWYSWLLFFLKGLEIQSKLSLNLGLKIDNLFKESKSTIEKEKANLNLIKVLEYMFKHPYVTAPILNKNTNIPLTTCKRYLEMLSKYGIIMDLAIHKKQRVFANIKLIKILRNI